LIDVIDKSGKKIKNLVELKIPTENFNGFPLKKLKKSLLAGCVRAF